MGKVITKNIEAPAINFKIKMLSIVVLLCGLLSFVTDSFYLANTSDNYVENSGYSLLLDSSDSPATSPSIYSASIFEHHRQAAKWLMTEIIDNLKPTPDSDHYLLPETLPPQWFLLLLTTKHRISGWKDANLIYKIKNALI
ncbi:MAG: hypothetical protein HRU24_14535 [Gammaproteobacteria bacterium]|nr:hypothetical protein [Gammaproteobacteria bacterium]